MSEIYLKHDNSLEVHFKLPDHQKVHHLIQFCEGFHDRHLVTILDDLLVSHLS